MIRSGHWTICGKMIKTLLMYDGKMSSAERIAGRLSYLIGNAKVCELSEAPDDLSPYGGFCFVFNFYGAVTAANASIYLRTHSEEMKNSRIAMVGIGFADLGFMNFIVELEKSTGLHDLEGYFLSRESETDRVGAEIGKLMRKPEHPMEEKQIAAAVDAFLSGHTTLALATAARDFIRNTPLEYVCHKDLLYIMTEGGNKFRGILENGRFCAAVFDPFKSMGTTKGLQITGEADLVPVGSAEYEEVMGVKGITKEHLDKLPITMFMIRLTPMKYEMLDTAFAKEGYDVHQTLLTSFQQRNWEAGAVFAKETAARADQKARIESADGEAVEELEEDGEQKENPDLEEGVGQEEKSDWEETENLDAADTEDRTDEEASDTDREELDENGELTDELGADESSEIAKEAEAARAAEVADILKEMRAGGGDSDQADEITLPDDGVEEFYDEEEPEVEEPFAFDDEDFEGEAFEDKDE